jgi:hypothetical protein
VDAAVVVVTVVVVVVVSSGGFCVMAGELSERGLL